MECFDSGIPNNILESGDLLEKALESRSVKVTAWIHNMDLKRLKPNLVGVCIVLGLKEFSI